jgi:NAD(P)-dependent dehydrogenase (short-subunit alcohol dehydrogenase family)
MSELLDKVAIVTGGASGIGLEIALDLGRRGARVVICDLADPAGAVDELTSKGVRATGIETDVSVPDSVDSAVAAVLGSHGRLDILINNAGLFTGITRAPFDQLDVAEWTRVLEVNVTGPWLFSRAAWAPMRRAGAGRIVHITSASVFSAPPLMLHYVASKGALTAMTRAMAREMGPDGITVNAVAPGFTLSSGVLERRQDMLRTTAERARSQRVIQRDQTPGDVVGAVAFLCGDGAAFISGQTLVVDGGAVMH